ncbi:MAG: hypothetical protein A2117_00955 [Candidatus Wildermuthbacteria bacterium GWA2_46_15]|uniref:Secretion system C-terminal sorting domain-containing protein n=1 Tax=Candidatus Wildermuthbacteria bacterium GWA2_46_15 TaxID=1802443 RepID=A0A1G2QPN5_9BACT|nr:MAG: hypothetical protein A2117_00955 [Candidatus Wildermuthbacteria bacterium GWA2_46_15]
MKKVMVLALAALFLGQPVFTQKLITDLSLVQVEPTEATLIFTTLVEGTTALYWGVYGAPLKYQDFGGGNVKIHNILLNNLTPNTFYECFAASVLVSGQNIWSEKISFKTPFVGPIIISAGERREEFPLPVLAGQKNLRVVSVQFEAHDTLPRYFLREIQFQLEPILMRSYIKSVQLTNEDSSWSSGGGNFDQLGKYSLLGLNMPLNETGVKKKLFLVLDLENNAPVGWQFRCRTFGDWLAVSDTNHILARAEGAAVGNYYVIVGATAVDFLPEINLFLAQNYPNPFNPTTTIQFILPVAQNVSLRVYDALGRERAVLIKNEVLSAGRQQFVFDGSTFSSGAYFYRLETTQAVLQKSMILLK